MEQNRQFRTAGFGGFHRQDVLDYIERTAKEQTEKRAELTRQLEQAQSDARAREDELTALRAQLDAVRLELEQTAAQRDALEAARAELQGQLDQLLEDGQSAEQLREQLEDFRRREAGDLQRKSDYADIELDARQRAREQLARAQAQADAVTAQAQAEHDALLAQARAQADTLLAETRAQSDEQLAQAQAQAEEQVRQARAESLRFETERRQRMEQTRRSFDAGSAELQASVTAALREVENLRQTLLDLNGTFEENVHTVDELCEGEQ